MGLLDAFKHAQKTRAGFDRELIERLERYAYVNAQVKAGALDKDRALLCMSVDEDEKVDSSRPSVHFKLQPLDRDGDCWRLLACIDDALGYLRFFIDVNVDASKEPYADKTDTQDLPGLALWFVRHPEYESGSLARTFCLMNWRAQLDDKDAEAFFTEQRDEPLVSGTVVMGAQLVHAPHLYGAPGDGNWMLLKCDAPGPFFVAFDVETGEAEMFPRRFDSEGYSFAMDLLRTVA